MLRYKILGHSGLRVSELCLGAMTFGEEYGWGANLDECRAMLDQFANLGGNFIDTANGYTGGTSERFVGQLVKGQRERFVIATKFNNSTARSGPTFDRHPNAAGNHRKSMTEALNASLTRLGTDYIDLYWVHTWDSITPVDETMRALDDAVRAGKILYIGMSNAPAWWIARANTMAELRGWSRFAAMQIEYSLAERTPERELIPMSRALDIGVCAWSPLAGGVLTGKYSADAPADGNRRMDINKRSISRTRTELGAEVAAIAKELGCSPAQLSIAWLMHGSKSIPILGARTRAQLTDNLGAAALNLDEAVMTRLDAISQPRLGYPHELLQSKMQRELTHTGAMDRIDVHRDEGGVLRP
jgi:aryl-alcohol dehydrogenase-like predicted oxidoreductase